MAPSANSYQQLTKENNIGGTATNEYGISPSGTGSKFDHALRAPPEIHAQQDEIRENSNALAYSQEKADL